MADILVVDDNRSFANVVCRMLAQRGYATLAAGSGEEALALARERPPDLAVVDLRLPGIDGIEVTRRLRRCNSALPVVLVTAYSSLEMLVLAREAGICHCVEKPFDLAVLEQVVEGWLPSVDGVGAVSGPATSGAGRMQPRETTRGLEGLIGTCGAMQIVFADIEKAAATADPVLVRGETGTGKELAARAIHRRSVRRDAAFVAVNCSAGPTTLVDDELFGHERGAFTDARERRAGIFEQADRGTLFLDEIAELPPEAQAKLLRVIEERSVRRLGGTSSVPVDFRLVAASHVDLAAAVSGGSFRADLYYRLDVLTIDLPPLRARGDDVALLVDTFFDRIRRARELPVTALSPEARACLLAYPWPGNVRELDHALRKAIVTAGLGTVEWKHLPSAVREIRGRTATGPAARIPALPEGMSLADALGQHERAWIVEVLEASNGHVGASAHRLGISRRNLHTKLRRYGIDGRRMRRR